MINVAHFVGHNERQRLACRRNSCGSTDTVNVLLNLTRQVILQNPVDVLEVETAGRHIGADEHATGILGSVTALTSEQLIERKVVGLTILVLQVTVQLVDAFVIKDLSLFLIGARICDTTTTAVPVVLLADGLEKVHELTVACEHNNLLFLVRIQEFKKVYKSILGRNFHVELQHLLGDRFGEHCIVVGIDSVLILIIGA